MTLVMWLLDEFRHLKEPIVYKGVLRAGNTRTGNGFESVPKGVEAVLSSYAGEHRI